MPKIFIYGKEVEFNIEKILQQFKSLIPFSYDLFTYTLQNDLSFRYIISKNNIDEETRKKIFTATQLLENTNPRDITYVDLMENLLNQLSYIEFFPDLVLHLTSRSVLAKAFTEQKKYLEAIEQRQKIMDWVIRIKPPHYDALLEAQAKKIIEYYPLSVESSNKDQALKEYIEILLKELDRNKLTNQRKTLIAESLLKEIYINMGDITKGVNNSRNARSLFTKLTDENAIVIMNSEFIITSSLSVGCANENFSLAVAIKTEHELILFALDKNTNTNISNILNRKAIVVDNIDVKLIVNSGITKDDNEDMRILLSATITNLKEWADNKNIQMNIIDTVDISDHVNKSFIINKEGLIMNMSPSVGDVSKLLERIVFVQNYPVLNNVGKVDFQENCIIIGNEVIYNIPQISEEQVSIVINDLLNINIQEEIPVLDIPLQWLSNFIENNSNHFLNLVKNLYDFKDAESAKLEIIEEAVNEILYQITNSFLKKDINIKHVLLGVNKIMNSANAFKDLKNHEGEFIIRGKLISNMDINDLNLFALNIIGFYYVVHDEYKLSIKEEFDRFLDIYIHRLIDTIKITGIFDKEIISFFTFDTLKDLYLAINNIDFKYLTEQEKNNIINFQAELINIEFYVSVRDIEEKNVLQLIEIKKFLSSLLKKHFSEKLENQFNKFIDEFNKIIFERIPNLDHSDIFDGDTLKSNSLHDLISLYYEINDYYNKHKDNLIEEDINKTNNFKQKIIEGAKEKFVIKDNDISIEGKSLNEITLTEFKYITNFYEIIVENTNRIVIFEERVKQILNNRKALLNVPPNDFINKIGEAEFKSFTNAIRNELKNKGKNEDIINKYMNNNLSNDEKIIIEFKKLNNEENRYEIYIHDGEQLIDKFTTNHEEIVNYIKHHDYIMEHQYGHLGFKE